MRTRGPSTTADSSAQAPDRRSFSPLVAAVRTGERTNICRELAALAELPQPSVERLIDIGEPEPLAVLCRAVEARSQLFGAIYARLQARAPKGHFAMTPQIQTAMRQYYRVQTPQAARLVAMWRRVPATVWQHREPDQICA